VQESYSSNIDDWEDPREKPGPDDPPLPNQWISRTVVDPETGKPMTVRSDRWMVAQWLRDNPGEPVPDFANQSQIRSKASYVRKSLWKVYPGAKDFDPKLIGWCPNQFKFILQFGGNPWPGKYIAIQVVGHMEASGKRDLFHWAKETAQAVGKNMSGLPEIRSGVDYRFFTSQGSFGSMIKDRCGSIVKAFDEIAAFVKMIERSPEMAKDFMSKNKGQKVTSGDVRWYFTKALG